jgi:hypothetical protein
MAEGCGFGGVCRPVNPVSPGLWAAGRGTAGAGCGLGAATLGCGAIGAAGLG